MNTKKTYSEFVHVDLVLIRFHRPLWLTELQWRFNCTTALYIPSRHIKRAHKKARARADGWCMTQRERERELARLFMCFGVCNSIGHTVFIRETQKFGEVYFYLKLYISITSKPIGFEHLGKLHIGPVMVLGCFIFRNNSCNGLIYISIFCPFQCRAPKC